MLLGDSREQEAEKRGKDTAKLFADTGIFHQLHQSAEESHAADQADGDFYRLIGEGEQVVLYGLHVAGYCAAMTEMTTNATQM